ncbi:hypothetical protein MNAN1_002008 [Malassezia nana]|uniref:GDP/GTP exchange factor Sec2 N-terminal domain-containing protein n=1 Tax=Malassezia nana TaxID=180528 RepID=A0AAF0EM04_9BASI|nr:hypothetical protein MNAN1_002008 [Malassezia nana]
MGKGGKQRQSAKAASHERTSSKNQTQPPAPEPEPSTAASDPPAEGPVAIPEAEAPVVSMPEAETTAEPAAHDETVPVTLTVTPAEFSTDEAPILSAVSDPMAVEVSKAEPPRDMLERLSAEEREAELRSQVTGLNAKLVDSINRMSDLEDELSVAHNRILVHTTRIAELSKERDQYISAMNTGLLVEKAHVTSEMQRMMERVAEETAQRGKAESDKTRIEAELEELSAALFNEANSMVAVERLARARAEEKSQQLEDSLRDTERMMQEQQAMLKNLQAQVDALSINAPEAPPALVPPVTSVLTTTISTNIQPYSEFLQFLDHLRSLHDQLAPYFDMQRRGIDWTTLSTITPSPSIGGTISPSMHQSGSMVRHRDYPHLPIDAEHLVQLSSQLTLPFIRRTHEEDADPCLRLSQAPGLNWLTRRQATSAILDGNVVIEPLFPGGTIADEEVLRAEYGGLAPMPCALCGMPLLNVSALLPGASSSASSIAAWPNPLKEGSGRRSLPSLFQSLRRGLDRSQSGDRSHEVKEGDEIFSQDAAPPMRAETLPIPTHYFRLSDHATSRHLVCTHHCLQRLRVVCAFWTFVRTLERAIVLEGKMAPDCVGQTRILPASSPLESKKESGAAEATKEEAEADKAEVQASDETPAEGDKKVEETDKAEEQASDETPAEADKTTEAADKAEAQASDETPAEAQAEDQNHVQADSQAPTDSNPATDANAHADADAEQDDLDVFNEALEDHTEAPLSAPPLPVRPSTQLAPGRDSFSVHPDRAHLAWEENLWAEVIRYKELMWKARVGVDLAHLDIG